ncbi:TPA: hypothetical protein VPA43_001885 [Streptococcus pyogenes]|nr:hypothetical protein [Streptococcus pyogenes]
MSKSYKNKKEGQHYDLKVIHDASKDKHDCMYLSTQNPAISSLKTQPIF